MKSYSFRSGDVWRSIVAFNSLVGLAALGVAIAALFLPNVGPQLDTLRSTDTNLTAALAAANMHIDMLNSQIVEIMMNDATNVTLLRNGTFIWGVSLIQDPAPPFATCNALTVSGFTIAAAGTGYRVGDLITVNLDDVAQTYLWDQHPVLRVDTVGGSGEVLTFTVLTPGCFEYDNGPNSVMDTLSVVGSGFTVQTVGPTYTPTVGNGYYDYPTPPPALCTALQTSQYSVYQLTIGPSAFTLLHLNTPPIPMTFQRYGSTFFGAGVTTLQIYMYEFEPREDDIVAMGTKDYIFPLTQKNFNAISFPSTDDCFALGQCIVNVNFFTEDTLRALEFYTQFADPPVRNETWIRTRITPLFEIPGFDVTSAVFSLKEPWVLVLPAL